MVSIELKKNEENKQVGQNKETEKAEQVEKNEQTEQVEENKQIKETEKVEQNEEAEETEQVEKNKQTEMHEMINESLEKFKKVKRGDVIKGIIVKENESGYLVDIKYKMEGFLPKNEASILAEDAGTISNALEIGDEVYVFVTNVDEKNGNISLSKEKAKYLKFWEKLSDVYKKKEKIKAEVIEKNDNGLIVDVGIKGFVPKSQIEQKFIKDEDLDKYIGKKLDFIILKLEKKNNKVILSHRQIVEKERKILKKETLANLEVGQTTEGVITNITKFGAFIDIGGIEGLLHISEITWRDTGNATKLLKIGEKVKVKIIDFDKTKAKISLSIKKLTEDPWENVKERFVVGDDVEGTVTKLKNFGAFVEIEEGLNGLLHISEMAWAYVKDPSEIISEGDVLKLRILELDPEKRKISLGLKQMMENPWDKIEEKYSIGSVVDGKITQVTSYGANVELESGVTGVIQISEINWEYVEKPSDILKKHMVLPLKIIKIDKDAHLIFLSRKNTLPNPWEGIEQDYKVNDTVKGKVTRMINVGAFVQLDKGIEGFVPISEIDWGRINHPNQILKKDSEYEFKIININKEKLQITLSRKKLQQDPWSAVKKKYPVGTLVEGKVVNLKDFGAFINLEGDIDGLVPLSEISTKRIEKPESVLSVGDEVLTLVTKIDNRRKKISLSIRRAEKEEQKRFMKEYNKKQNVDKILFKDIFGDLFNGK
ncbi:MAG: S1 RNA-binding domain-containing protein [Candidatus Caldatribacteriota bacterium]|nr:S1 RNA-binding domain-containing protein [Candidatus Caldatribacteriota bacterium]